MGKRNPDRERERDRDGEREMYFIDRQKYGLISFLHAQQTLLCRIFNLVAECNLSLSRPAKVEKCEFLCLVMIPKDSSCLVCFGGSSAINTEMMWKRVFVTFYSLVMILVISAFLMPGLSWETISMQLGHLVPIIEVQNMAKNSFLAPLLHKSCYL